MDRPSERRFRADWHRKAFVEHCGRVPEEWPGARSDAWWLFFEPWSEALAEAEVTAAEFEAASKRLAKAPPFDAKKHLFAILEQVEQLRRAGMAAGPPADDPAVLSAGCPDCGGRTGLASRRLVVRVGGGPEQEVGVAFPCLCPMGRQQAARFRRDNPRGLDLAEWHSLWLADASHASWPPLPPRGRRRALGGWRLKGGHEVAIVRCLDDVLLPEPAGVASAPAF